LTHSGTTISSLILACTLLKDHPNAGPWARELLKDLEIKENAEALLQMYDNRDFKYKETVTGNAQRATDIIERCHKNLDMLENYRGDYYGKHKSVAIPDQRPTTTACPGSALPQEKPAGCGDTNVQPLDKPNGCGDTVIKPIETPGCGDVEIKPPLIFITPAELDQKPLYETQSVEEAKDDILKKLPNLRPFGKDNSELKQYISDTTYEDALKIVKENTSPNSIKGIITKDGPLTVFEYDNEDKIIVRKFSSGIEAKKIDGLPTIEVQRKKIRSG
jgi:hypothetical protein